MRIAVWIAIALFITGAVVAMRRVIRVRDGRNEIPVFPDARESPPHTRYWLRPLSWDDRSSARIDRIFAVSAGTTLLAVGRQATNSLTWRGWYLVTPDDLTGRQDPQVIVWQRDPDERLDLSQLWPVSGMSRTERLYGGRFPEAFLDAPVVIGWTWVLGGPRSSRPAVSTTRSIVRPPRAPSRAPDSIP